MKWCLENVKRLPRPVQLATSPTRGRNLLTSDQMFWNLFPPDFFFSGTFFVLADGQELLRCFDDISKFKSTNGEHSKQLRRPPNTKAGLTIVHTWQSVTELYFSWQPVDSCQLEMTKRKTIFVDKWSRVTLTIPDLKIAKPIVKIVTLSFLLPYHNKIFFVNYLITFIQQRLNALEKFENMYTRRNRIINFKLVQSIS